MLTYQLTVAGLTRQLPVCPLNDNVSIAGFVILGDEELTEACAKALLPKLPPHDVMITAESKGIPLVHELCRQSGEKRYVLARKSIKLYMPDPVTVKVQSITTANTQTLIIDRLDMEYLHGTRVVVVDDVISTGNSLKALEELVEQAGGTVVGKMAILAEGDARNRDDIIYLEHLPLLHPDGTPIE